MGTRRTITRPSLPPIELEEVDGVFAMRIPGRDLASTQNIPAAVARFEPQVRALSKAGWRFVEHRNPKETAPSARVLLRNGSELVLSDGSLLVKFRDGISGDRVEEILDKFGLRLVKRVPVARNLLVAKPKSVEQPDGLDVLEPLLDQAEIEFAEPQLIESIGSR